MLSQKELELTKLEIDGISKGGVGFNEDKGPAILNIINRFTNQYGDMIEGKFVKESAVECLGGSRINYIFHNIFVKSIKDINPLEYLTD